MKKFWIQVLLVLVTGKLEAQHILYLLEGQQPQRAKLEDVGWMKGYWKAEVWGGNAAESWMEPMGNAMAGSFSFSLNDTVVFVEMMVVVEENHQLTLKLKHFDRHLKGWEEKDESVDFPLLYLEPGRAYFDGLTYLLKDSNTLHVYVAIEENGVKTEQLFAYKRASL